MILYFSANIQWLAIADIKLICISAPLSKGNLRGVVANVSDFDNFVTVFELQSRYYVNFKTKTIEKGKNPLYPNSNGLKSTTTILL